MERIKQVPNAFLFHRERKFFIVHFFIDMPPPIDDRRCSRFVLIGVYAPPLHAVSLFEMKPFTVKETMASDKATLAKHNQHIEKTTLSESMVKKCLNDSITMN